MPMLFRLRWWASELAVAGESTGSANEKSIDIPPPTPPSPPHLHILHLPSRHRVHTFCPSCHYLMIRMNQTPLTVMAPVSKMWALASGRVWSSGSNGRGFTMASRVCQYKLVPQQSKALQHDERANLELELGSCSTRRDLLRHPWRMHVSHRLLCVNG